MLNETDRAVIYSLKAKSKAALEEPLNDAVREYLSLRKAYHGRLGGEGKVTADDVASAGATCIREARKLLPDVRIKAEIKHDLPMTGITLASGAGWEVNENRNRLVHLYVY